MPGSLPDYQIDPYRLVEDDIKDMFDEIQLVRFFIFISLEYDLCLQNLFFFFFREVKRVINKINISAMLSVVYLLFIEIF